jgi:MFS family permease
MSPPEVAGLFAVWTVTGVLAEVPSGALSDRLSRRRVLAAGGTLQAAGYATWLLAPSFAGFALGFVVWGIGGALVSGTVEALLFESLTDLGEPERYATLRGHVTAAGHLGQIPAAGLATGLVALGGIEAAGWMSVGICLAAATLTCTFPNPPRTADPPEDTAAPASPSPPTGGPAPTVEAAPAVGAAPAATGVPAGSEPGYLALLRTGLTEALADRVVLGALIAAALVGGSDALEEFFPLVVGEAEVPVVAVPVVLLAVALSGAAGAWLGGRAGRIGALRLAGVVAAAGLALLTTGHLGIAALAVCYGLQQCAVVVTDTRVQERLSGRARATATSAAALGTEIVALGVLAAWAVGEAAAVAVLLLAIAPVVWAALRR